MKRVLSYIVSLAILILLCNLLGGSNFFIEKIYIPFYNAYDWLIGGFTNLFSFSIGDILYFIIGIYLIYLAVKFLKIIFRRQKEHLIQFSTGLLKKLNILVLVYYLVWGWVYFEPDLEQVYPAKNIEETELKTLAIKYLEICKESRMYAPENSEGVYVDPFTDKKFSNYVSHLYSQLPDKVKRLPYAHHTRVKKSLYSKMLVYFGIGGYYNPFTQECQYIGLLSDYKKPNTLAHEMAHKWAFGKENEANFIAFLLADLSDNNDFEYSTKISALNHLYRNIYPDDSLFVKDQKKQFSEGMIRDFKADSLLQVKYASPLEHGFYGLNNAFLKLNQQEGSSSYSRYIRLVVGYERSKK